MKEESFEEKISDDHEKILANVEGLEFKLDEDLFVEEDDKCLTMCCNKQKFLELCSIYPDSVKKIEQMANDRNRKIIHYRRRRMMEERNDLP
jgi:hypothetical protein